jgi:hypothetical protein
MPLPSRLLPLALAVTAGHADPIRFDNSDGTFVWTKSGEYNDDGNCLVINEPPTQDGLFKNHGFGQFEHYPEGTPHFYELFFHPAGDEPDRGLIVRNPDPTIIIDEDDGVWKFYFATVFAPGDVIGPGLSFSPLRSAVLIRNYYTDPITDIGLGDSAYIGLSFPLEGALHYGWIRVERDGDDYLPTAWGYESTPDTPIVIPGACYPDLDGNGTLDLFDFLAFVNLFNTADPAADCTPDGQLDLFDFLCFTNTFNEGC